MIRSSKVTLKFANTEKKRIVSNFIQEYTKVVHFLIDSLWQMEKIPVLLPRNITSTVDTWLTARVVQAAGKQASGIVRGTRKKQSDRLYRIEVLEKSGRIREATRLREVNEKKRVTKPSIGTINPELDSRFVKIEIQGGTSFDGWVTLKSLGNDISIPLPFRRHKHLNSMIERGTMKGGIRLSVDSITLIFEIPDKISPINGEILGIDIGQNSILSCSDGFQVVCDGHGHTYASICERMSRKKRGSKGFRKVSNHRTNFVNWSVKQLNLDGVMEVHREDINSMFRGRRIGRKLSHWNYGELFGALDRRLEEAGVRSTKVNPAYTSQRCSHCGWVHDGNRKGHMFVCKRCGFHTDADLNAATNLSLDLPVLGGWRSLDSKKGFYWMTFGQEPIVPATKKPEIVEDFS